MSGNESANPRQVQDGPSATGGAPAPQARPCCAACGAVSVLLLLLVAIVATLPGWLPGRVYVPTDALQLFAPWGDPAQWTDSSAAYHAQNEVLLDQTTQFVPWTIYTVQRLRHTEVRDGKTKWSPEIPLWNPYQQLGAPFIGNGQSAVFYPTTALHVFLPPTWSWTISAALRLWLAGVGLWLLAGRYGISPWGRLLAAIAFMLCGFNVVWLNHPHTNVFVLLPWAILAIERLIDRVTFFRTALAALVFAVQFLGGHPATCMHLLLTCGLVYLAHLIVLNPLRALRALPAVLVAAAAGAAAAGLQLLPMWDYVSVSAAKAYREGELAAGGRPFSPLHLLGTFFPYAFGYPPDRLMPYQAWLAMGVPNTSEIAGGFIGTVPLVLAIIAVLWRRTRLVIAFAAIALVATAIAINLPPFGLLVKQLPGLKLAQNARLMGAAAFALAILAGFGFDAILARVKSATGAAGAAAEPNRGVRRLRGTLEISAIALAALGVLIAVGLWAGKGKIIAKAETKIADVYRGDGSHEYSKQYWKDGIERAHTEGIITGLRLLIPASMLAAASLGIFMQMRRPGSRWLASIVLGVSVFDLLAFAIPYNFGSPSSTYCEVNRAIGWLLERQAADPNQSFRVAGTFRNLHPESTTAYGLRDIRGYDAVGNRRWSELMQRVDPSTIGNDQGDVKRVTNIDHPALKLVGLRYVITDPSHPIDSSEWKLVYQQGEAWIYERVGNMPRFWMAASSVWYATPEQVFDRVAGAARIGPPPPPTTAPATQPAPNSNDFDPRQVVLLDKQWPAYTKDLMENARFYSTSGSGSSRATIHVLEDRPEKIRLEVRGGAGWLVLADAFADGWVARIGGYTPTGRMFRESERVILPAYGVLRAVPLLDRHSTTLTFEYQPRVWKNGLLLSAGGAISILILLGLGLITSMQVWHRSAPPALPMTSTQPATEGDDD